MLLTISSPNNIRSLAILGLSLVLILLTLSLTKYHTGNYIPVHDGHHRQLQAEKHFSYETDSASSLGNYKTSSGKCQPVHHIMFVKTHKCASTSIQNVLLRYGHRNNLTFVIPPFSNNLGEFDKFEKFHPSLALPLPSECGNEYGIFTHHARYNKDIIPRIMPKDSVYISILREPAAMYQSIWTFFSLHLRFSAPLEEFVKNPRLYYFNESNHRSLQFGRNPIMSDFGLEKEDFDNLTVIKETINYIDKHFSLIMISHQMDESLVLLRELLCWEWDDVVVFHLNRQSKHLPVELTEKVTSDILAWNSADNLLYQHFLAKFEEKKSIYGKERMKDDLQKLRSLRKAWERKCFAGHLIDKTNQPGSSTTINEECQYFCMDELEFTDRIRAKLWPNYGSQPHYRGRKGKNAQMFDKNFCDEVWEFGYGDTANLI